MILGVVPFGAPPQNSLWPLASVLALGVLTIYYVWMGYRYLGRSQECGRPILDRCPPVLLPTAAALIPALAASDENHAVTAALAVWAGLVLLPYIVLPFVRLWRDQRREAGSSGFRSC